LETLLGNFETASSEAAAEMGMKQLAVIVPTLSANQEG
jgi:hypothetical protein